MEIENKIQTPPKKPGLFSGLFAKKEKKEDSLNVLETDLIKDEVEIKFEWKKDLPGAFALFIIAFILILETYLFLSWWGESRGVENSHYLEREITYIKGEIEKIKGDYETSNAFKNRLIVSSNALNQHIYWTNLFSFLEKNTLKNLYYNSFSGNLSGTYVLPATTNDVRAISYQSKVLLTDPNISLAEVSDEQIINEAVSGGDNGATTTKTKVNFNLKFVLNKAILNK